MTNNFCVNGQRTFMGFKLFTVFACIVQILFFVIWNYSNEIISFFTEKTDCCPTEEKEKRKYKIFKSKNVTNSVAGELLFLLIYAYLTGQIKKTRAKDWFGK